MPGENSSRDWRREIVKLLDHLGDGPVLVHSDIFAASPLISPIKDRRGFLEEHVDLLRSALDGRDLWMPAFNYDYTCTGHFAVRTDGSQAGSLTEYFRTTHAHWRTSIPVFSFCGTGRSPEVLLTDRVDPFGSASAFAELVKRDGSILFYGAPFSSATIIHHAERLAGDPVYRYDKLFSGSVLLLDGAARTTVLLYHVRPLNRGLEYNWPRLYLDLERAGLLRTLKTQAGDVMLIAVSAQHLCSAWSAVLSKDAFHLLDDATRAWAEPLYRKLGRRFHINDFEKN